MREAEEVLILGGKFGQEYEEGFEQALEGRTTILAMTKRPGDHSCPHGILLTRPTPVPSPIATPIASEKIFSPRPAAVGSGDEDPVIQPPTIKPSTKKTELYSDTGSRSDMLTSMVLGQGLPRRVKSHGPRRNSLARLASSADDSTAQPKPLPLRSISPCTKATDTEGQTGAIGRHGIGEGEEIPLMGLRRGAKVNKSDKAIKKVKKPWLDKVLSALCVPCTL